MADSLVWSKIMSYDLSGNLKFEIQRFNLLLKGISLDRIDELISKFNTSHFPTVLTMEDIKDGKVPVDKIDAVSLLTDEKLKLFYKDLQEKVNDIKKNKKKKQNDTADIVDLDGDDDKTTTTTSSTFTSFLSSIIHSKGVGLKLNSGLYGNLFSTKGASNNWVVGPSLSKSNKPLLCNDPHLQLTAPSIWIMTHINIKDLKEDVWGASFVGLPGVS